MVNYDATIFSASVFVKDPLRNLSKIHSAVCQWLASVFVKDSLRNLSYEKQNSCVTHLQNIHKYFVITLIGLVCRNKLYAKKTQNINDLIDGLTKK